MQWKFETNEYRSEQLRRWHPWFAWHPALVPFTSRFSTRVWLERIWRRLVDIDRYDNVYAYSLINPDLVNVCPRVYLGGTCNGSTWRDKLIPMLDIDYFNPVAARLAEIRQRKECDFLLYVITPKMTGTYAIAEAVDDSNKRPEKTILCLLNDDDGVGFTKAQIKSLAQVGNMVNMNGVRCVMSLTAAAQLLNARAKELTVGMELPTRAPTTREKVLPHEEV